jgi:hypothetical protein
MILENDIIRVEIDEKSGALSSFIDKKTGTEMLGEKRLMANFRICLPLDDYQSHYIEGMEQKMVSIERHKDEAHIRFSGMHSEKGFYDLDLRYTIQLKGDSIIFHSKLSNNTHHPVSEFWFPRLGDRSFTKQGDQ